MAVRAGWVVAVARGSAAAWQRVACNPETLPPDRVLALICLGPLHLLTRLAACLCVPSSPPAPPSASPPLAAAAAACSCSRPPRFC
ncbi:hypothetical protein ZWY2020_018387 [Hordeum vulgare]|nr:hypothetical protein ZWY2020_018387 [Hordeum vulgare]